MQTWKDRYRDINYCVRLLGDCRRVQLGHQDERDSLEALRSAYESGITFFDAVARIRAIATESGEPMADVCMAWLLAQEGMTSVIAGGRNSDQARRNARAAEYHHRAVIIQQQADRLNPFDKPRGFIFKARSREEYELWKSQQTNPRLW